MIGLMFCSWLFKTLSVFYFSNIKAKRMTQNVSSCINFSINILSVKLFLLVVTISIISFQNCCAQDSTIKINPQLSQLINSYYNIKNALVAGDPGTGSSNAEQFLKITNGIDYKVISEGNINALLKDATAISEIKDLKGQRIYFANLSTNMLALARELRLTMQPIYITYCPMLKVRWLSNEKEVKNPYYCNAILTCGKVEETLQ